MTLFVRRVNDDEIADAVLNGLPRSSASNSVTNKPSRAWRTCVPKLEFGNEMSTRRTAFPNWSLGTRLTARRAAYRPASASRGAISIFNPSTQCLCSSV